ncbi:hypothetical protein GCM10009834_42340 [Streptomonospora arabica]|uniref:Uncharacterized protein n=1 Tax=Streptomonospora halophila TaxID=427369 RepID=A0ABP9GIF3_9ACTN
MLPVGNSFTVPISYSYGRNAFHVKPGALPWRIRIPEGGECGPESRAARRGNDAAWQAPPGFPAFAAAADSGDKRRVFGGCCTRRT